MAVDKNKLIESIKKELKAQLKGTFKKGKLIKEGVERVAWSLGEKAMKNAISDNYERISTNDKVFVDFVKNFSRGASDAGFQHAADTFSNAGSAPDEMYEYGTFREHSTLEEEELLNQPEIEYNIEDQIGNFWVVKNAIKESTEEDIVQEVDVFTLAEMLANQQITKADIAGMYKMENKARRAASSCIKERDKDLKETIKTGDNTRKDLLQAIEDCKMEIQAKTSQGISEPGQRDSVAMDLDGLYKNLDRKESLLKRLDASLESEKASKDKEKDE